MPIALTRRQSLAVVLAAALLPGAGLAQSTPQIAGMVMGDPDAPVTVVEYASLTCPHCANFHTTVLPEIKENFIDTGQVKLEFREVYFDRAGLWAAMMARCAPQDRYFGIVDVLFQRQADWAVGTPEEVTQKLYGIGRQAGMTDAQMDACMSDRDYAEALVARFQETSTADEIEGTPSFIIDGEKSPNMGYEEFEAKLNEALGS